MTSGDFDALVVARSPALLRLALMLTGNLADAEDLLQTALLRAYGQRGRLVEMAAPAAYLRRIVVNEHLRAGRHAASRPRTTTLEGIDAPAPAEPDPAEHDAVWRLLAALPRQQRAVLALRYYEGLPDAEIADLLDIGESTVRSTAHRALFALRARLAETPEEARP